MPEEIRSQEMGVPSLKYDSYLGICGIITVKVLAYMLSYVTYAKGSNKFNREHAMHVSWLPCGSSSLYNEF